MSHEADAREISSRGVAQYWHSLAGENSSTHTLPVG